MPNISHINGETVGELVFITLINMYDRILIKTAQKIQSVFSEKNFAACFTAFTREYTIAATKLIQNGIPNEAA